MIVTSKVDGKKYQWIKIPRTGTVAYRFLFFPELQNKVVLHHHTKYGVHSVCNTCDEKQNLPAFTLIRNPLTRFISSLKYIVLRQQYSELHTDNTYNVFNRCDICGYTIQIHNDTNKQFNKNITTFLKFWENEDIFYEFLYSNFEKNCNLKSGMTYKDIFNTPDSTFIRSFFEPQMSVCYHPAVKIFKYENINEYNLWIENELGYDTSKLQKINISEKVNDEIPIDFTSNKFKELVKYLFHDDFKYFGYDI